MEGVAKQRHFLVVDVYQIVLVEPDVTCLIWVVATHTISGTHPTVTILLLLILVPRGIID